MTLPVLSYFHGGTFTKAIQVAFSDIRIEDLWIPYYCVSTNMTQMDMSVHTKVGLVLQITLNLHCSCM